MQTNIHPSLNTIPAVNEAEDILRSCVHCGFCTATCPTYQELNDERDGPRGRIYLIKQFLETGTLTEASRKHLDRCLSCRSCETTCPSGVQYGRLLDIGRSLAEQHLPRNHQSRLVRWGLRQILPHPKRFKLLLNTGQIFKPLLSEKLKQKIPPKRQSALWPSNSHKRVMLILDGCVQPATSPNTNISAARVLDKLGISLITAPKAGCCGAVSQHLSADHEALNFMRKNIDAWWPAIEGRIEAGVEAGVEARVETRAEAIVITTSGCGVTVQEYGHLLKDDPAYAHKAKKVSELCKDISQVLMEEDLTPLKLANTQDNKTGDQEKETNNKTNKGHSSKTALHCPCSLQHGMQQTGNGNKANIEQILQRAGIELAKTKDSHLCCGSAGTYSILQPELSQKLLENKLKALTLEQPVQIVTGNIGCQLHLESQSPVPVKHWIELLSDILQRT